MSDHIYVISFTGEDKPHFVYAESEEMAMNMMLDKKKEAEILGKMKVKDYAKNEKSIQQAFQILLDNKRRKNK